MNIIKSKYKMAEECRLYLKDNDLYNSVKQ